MSAHLVLEWQFPVSSLPALLGGVLMAALVVVLLRVGRGRRDVVALALLLGNAACASLLAFTFDGFAGTYPMAVTIALTHAFWAMDGWLWACFAMMLLAERTRVPRPLRAFPTYLVPALAIAAVGLWKPELVYDFSLFVTAPLAADAPPGSFPLSHPRSLSILDRVSDLASPAFALLLAWWALRREESEEWSSVLLIALAAAGTGAFHAGTYDFLIGRPLDVWWTAVAILVLLVALGNLALFVLLLHEGVRGRPERRSLARGGAAFLLLMGAAGVAVGLSPFTPLVFSTFLAFATFTFPVVATYALLRHRLLGLDVKIRFAISRSTIAAIFVAVFFVASEGAQILFGQGNEWFGLLAAGALVFAIAPLQRVADRLAEGAVPPARADAPATRVVPAPAAAPAGGSREARAFACVVRAVLSDGPLTREKEAHLARAAHELGLSYPDALEILKVVEEEVRAA